MIKMEVNEEKQFTFIRGYATGLKLHDTLIALNLARTLHKGQKRKGGIPYISHPLMVADHAIALGITDDNIIAGCLLHDVIEDCDVDERKLKDAGLSQETISIVSKLTKHKIEGCDKENALKMYYDFIARDPKAMFIKILDRCHNVSTMIGAFSKEKMAEYYHETIDYVMPLMTRLKEYHPEYGNYLFILKYHIQSVCDVIAAVIQAEDSKEDK